MTNGEKLDQIFPDGICPFSHNWLKSEYKQSNSDEDCISREAVIDYIKDCTIDLGYENGTNMVIDVISNLPSVQPKSKIGHWIADVDRWGDVVTTVNGYRCSECGEFNTDKDNYCPNCGAKMVEPQNLKYADADTMMPAT